MTTSQQDSPRANHNGGTCPTWCKTDHGHVYAVTKSGAELRTTAHSSEPLSVEVDQPFVGVSKMPGGPATLIRVRMNKMPLEAVRLDAQQAETLADILESAPGQLGIARLIDELRTAAQMARDTDTPGEEDR